MNILNILFGRKNSPDKPDNSKLLKLLTEYYQQSGVNNTYENVILELKNGNSFLLLPETNTQGKVSQNLNLPIYDFDGLQVIAAFTDEKALISWTKQPTHYKVLPAQEILSLCEENQIDRIVIDTNLPTMFVVERSRGKVETHTIQPNEVIQIGIPHKPLNERILNKLLKQFKTIQEIQEVYHYGQTKDGEFSLVLGYKLSENNDDTKNTVIDAVQQSLQSEPSGQFIDLLFIKDNDLYAQIKNLSESLIYLRQNDFTY
jgi:hypothetical protein